MPSPENTPTQPTSEVITVPEWSTTEASDTGPKFDFPEQPTVENTPDNSVDDVKINKITVIDAQGTGEVRETYYGKNGPVKSGAESFEAAPVGSSTNRNLAKRALHRLFGLYK